MPSLPRSAFGAHLEITDSGVGERRATSTIDVPALGRTFHVTVHLAPGATAVSASTLQTLNEIANLSSGARDQILRLLYDDAMRAKESAQFGDPSPPQEQPPSGFFARLLLRPAKHRFIPLAEDDPRHPCNVPGGPASIGTKVEWLGLRIDENEALKSRFALLDCRPAWEEEHGAAVIMRNGVPVAVDNQAADLRQYDDA